MDNLFLNLFMATFWVGALLVAVHNYPRAQKYRSTIFAFLLAGVASAFLALWIYDLDPVIAWYRFAVVNEFTWHFLVVAPVEEAAKLLVFMAMMAWLKPSDAPLLPVLMALALGLGFALTENLVVYFNVSLDAMAFRTSFMYGHGSRVALSAVAYALIRYPSIMERRLVKRWIYLPAFALGVFCHACFNLATGVSAELAGFIQVLEGLVSILFIQVFAKSSPFAQWSTADRPRALKLLRESLALHPENARTRVRLALFLLAGHNQAEAGEAVGVLRGLSQWQRRDTALALVLVLARWNRSQGEQRYQHGMELVALLAASPVYRQGLASDFSRRLGIMLWLKDRKDRGRPLVTHKSTGLLDTRHALLEHTLDHYLGQLMQRSKLSIRSSLIPRPDFSAGRTQDLPEHIRKIEYRQRFALALQAQKRRYPDHQIVLQ